MKELRSQESEFVTISWMCTHVGEAEVGAGGVFLKQAQETGGPADEAP